MSDIIGDSVILRAIGWGGDYLAVALGSLPWKSWNIPDVLEQIQPSATTFRLDEGERQVLRLRHAAMPGGLAGLY